MKKSTEEKSFLSLDDLPVKTGIPDSCARSSEPIEQFFKSVYVAGKKRKNADDVVEQPGKFQILNTKYNLDNVDMIIVHIKEVLAKTKSNDFGEQTECFCYMDKKPYKGTSGRVCNENYTARKTGDVYCQTCLNNITIAGIWSTPDGDPILVDEKPVFIFVKAKMRF